MQLLPIKIHITLFLRASVASEVEVAEQEVRLLYLMSFLLISLKRCETYLERIIREFTVVSQKLFIYTVQTDLKRFSDSQISI